MKTIGELLSEKRQQQNLSLKQVAQATKIKLIYLQALEKNRFDQLPGSTFAKGFLRQYASYLHLDPETALAMFRRDFVENQSGQIVPRALLQPVKAQRRSLSLTFLLLFLAISSFLGFLGFQLYHYYSLPQVTLNQPVEGQVYSHSVPIQGKTNPNNIVKINHQTIVINDQGEFFLELNFPTGNQTIELVVTNPRGKSRLLKRSFQVVD